MGAPGQHRPSPLTMALTQRLATRLAGSPLVAALLAAVDGAGLVAGSGGELAELKL